MYERKKNTYEPPKTESNSNQDTTCIKAETNKLWLQLTQLLSDKLHQLICQKQGLLKRRFFWYHFIVYTFIRLLAYCADRRSGTILPGDCKSLWHAVKLEKNQGPNILPSNMLLNCVSVWKLCWIFWQIFFGIVDSTRVNSGVYSYCGLTLGDYIAPKIIIEKSSLSAK